MKMTPSTRFDSITGKIQASKEIVNIIKDVNSLAGNLMNVRYDHCNRIINMLADKVARRAHSHRKFVLYND